jgi:hypothetical protein
MGMGKTIQVPGVGAAQQFHWETALYPPFVPGLLPTQAISLLVTHRTDDFQNKYDPAQAAASALQPGTPDQVAPRPVIALRSAVGQQQQQQQQQAPSATHAAENVTGESGQQHAAVVDAEPACNGKKGHHHNHVNGQRCNGKCSSKGGHARPESAAGPSTPSPPPEIRGEGSDGVAVDTPGSGSGSGGGIAERAAAASKLKCPHKRLKGASGPCPECERELAPVAAEEVRGKGRRW